MRHILILKTTTDKLFVRVTQEFSNQYLYEKIKRAKTAQTCVIFRGKSRNLHDSSCYMGFYSRTIFTSLFGIPSIILALILMVQYCSQHIKQELQHHILTVQLSNTIFYLLDIFTQHLMFAIGNVLRGRRSLGIL